MAVVDNPDSREEDFRREWEWAERASMEAAKIREDDFKLAKLKIATEPRQKAVVKIIVAVVKLPSLVVLSILLPVLVLCNKDIPESIERFIAL